MHVSNFFQGTRYVRGDPVYYTPPGQNVMKGPYHIASRPRDGQYTLCSKEGDSVEGGITVAESTLKPCP
jgi:hypothetical protein